MKDGFYYLCPKCKQFKKIFYEVWYGRCYYAVELLEDGTQEYISNGNEADDILRCSCECGFRNENYSAEEFIVEIKDGKIIIDKYSYWDEFFNDLEEIAKQHDLKIAREVKNN